MSTIKRVKLVAKKELVTAALDSDNEAFIVYIAPVISSDTIVHLSDQAQIALLKEDEALTAILSEYIDFVDIFSLSLIVELSKHTKINDHAIMLIDDKQSSYKPIYRLKLVKLKILKTYIKTNLANSFIRPSKSPTDAPILFNHKLDSNLHLYVNYQGLNKLTTKN